MLPCSVDDDKSWANASLYTARENYKVGRKLWRTSGPTQDRANWIRWLRVFSSFENSWAWWFPFTSVLHISPKVQIPQVHSFLYLNEQVVCLSAHQFVDCPQVSLLFSLLQKKRRNSTDVFKRNLERRMRWRYLGGVTVTNSKNEIVFVSTFRQHLPSSDHGVYLHGLDLCFP